MNVGQWITKRAMTYPDRPFVKHGDREYNNREFNLRVNQLAQALAGLGVEKGRRVAAILDNSIGFLEILFAAAKLGAVLVPINIQLLAKDMAQILCETDPQLVVYHGRTSSKVGEILAVAANVPQCWRLDPGPDSLADLAGKTDGMEPIPSAEVRHDDPYVILYLPTTSGEPLGAVLTHDNILFGAIHGLLSYGLDKTFRSLVVAPMSQIASLTASVLSVVYGGGALVIEDFFSSSNILNLIVRERINYMFAVPTMYQLLTKAPEWAEVDFSHVHYFISGGAPMPVDVIQKYSREKGIKFPQGYGLTETGRLTSVDLADADRKAGSVGKEVFHVFLRIVDEAGQDVAPGELGEIIVQGPNVFQGYWRRPEATAAVFKDGWFHTKDLGRRDEEGFIYLAGRKVETIISAGRNIYPVEIERALLSLPGVKEAVAVGLPDPGKGQVVAAAVTLQSQVKAAKEELLLGLTDKIAAYKIPKSILILPELPRGKNNQMDREEIRRLLRP